jgi:hypothetical protein
MNWKSFIKRSLIFVASTHYLLHSSRGGIYAFRMPFPTRNSPTSNIMSSTSSAPNMASEPRQWSNKKRIILCADGTWKASDQGDKSNPSNVAKIARAIATTGRERDPKTGKDAEVKQVVFYQSGLGSGDLPLQRFAAGNVTLQVPLYRSSGAGLIRLSSYFYL